MSPLQIHSRRERALVTAADRVLALGAAMARPFRRRRAPVAPRRILLLRLERIGDLLMVLPAIADVHTLAPDAEIHLVVGSWNADLAGAIDPIKRVQTLDAAWLARRDSGLGLVSLLRAARRWRALKYDLVINFEPDVRSNLLAAASGAAWAAGYRSGGGGALLDVALDYDTRAHTTDNARRLVAATLGSSSGAGFAAVARPYWTTATRSRRSSSSPRKLTTTLRVCSASREVRSSASTSAADARSNSGSPTGSPTSRAGSSRRPAPPSC